MFDKITPEQLQLIAWFVLPGAISVYVYGLKVPQREFALKDKIAEAIFFSLLNFLVVWLPARWILSLDPVEDSVALVAVIT